MAKVFKRGKVYHHYYTDAHGKQRKRSTGLTSKKQAQEEADAFVARIKVGNLRGYDAELQLFEAIIAYEAAGKPSRFLDKITKHWGHMKVRLIKPAWVRAHAKDIYPDALPSTLNRQVITPLQAVINHAYQAEDGRQIKIEKFAVDPKKKSAVDAEWHEKFAEHALSFGMAAMARFMYETAARISEACRVQPEDVDLEARTVNLTKTKTKPRIARISQPMADMLAELMSKPRIANRMNKKKVNGIFGYASRHAVYNGWKTTCDRAGIPYAPPHSSGRVSFATELVVRQGIDPVTAAKLGGWASPKVMMDTYAKSDGSHDIIDSVFGAPIEKKAQNTPKTDDVSTTSENDKENNGLQGKIRSNRP
ncbi:tyrosine-type recombinase/integrase [Sinorhizobium meliloti]|uniref:tyrosine-type recombinase/integrase n=1 Tax=Rhizobium meliloti TaxID=382 RepID=UPI0023802ED2|nr:tyrosine-type recombinase/integrase [Sinorhizobium meliloti]MDE3796933.1 tyrosine-type recombinase/integrase [Sinorhizobium meliloti]